MVRFFAAKKRLTSRVKWGQTLWGLEKRGRIRRSGYFRGVRRGWGCLVAKIAWRRAGQAKLDRGALESKGLGHVGGTVLRWRKKKGSTVRP